MQKNKGFTSDYITMGIDPGIKETAIVTIKGNKILGCSTIKITPQVIENEFNHYIIGSIIGDIERIIQQFAPMELHVEKMFISMGYARSAALVVLQKDIVKLCEKYQTICYEVANATVKKNITGNSRAEKEEVAKIINKRFKTNYRDLNITDALAIALTYPPKKVIKRKINKTEKYKIKLDPGLLKAFKDFSPRIEGK